MKKLATLLTVLAFVCCVISSAQPGALDLSFNPGTGANSVVLTTALQPDGKIIIGGAFTSYNGTGRNRIARLNSDGSLDTSFVPGTGANDVVQKISLQPDGKIIIGGEFTNYNGTGRNHIARLNADGTLDFTFNPGSGANDWVYTTTLQPDGKIVIGGRFTFYNGSWRSRIARLNADGSLDFSFNPGSGANNYVRTTALQPDGKVIVGGSFTSYNGTGRNYVARANANGSLDTSFDPGTGANTYVITSVIQPDGKIIIAGWFTTYNGSGRDRIARVNADGTLDTSFNPGSGANNTIDGLALQPDGKIIIVGWFTSYNGTGRNRIARVNANGTLDTSFIPGTGANSWSWTTTLQPDEKIIIGGNFTSYNGTGRNRIARILPYQCFATTATISPAVCDSFTVPSGDETYTLSGTYMDTIPNIAGCDSIITINLDILNTTAIINPTACNDYTSPSGNYNWTSSGTYMDTIPNIAGCDSIITINLTIDTNTIATINPTACDSFPAPSGNAIYTISGTYMDTIPNIAGCDSIITINLTINTNTTATINPTACDSFLAPSGNATYTISGPYMDTIPNIAGCDSILTVNLTINSSYSIIDSPIDICSGDSVLINGIYETTTGTYYDSLTTVKGCDSIHSVVLTIDSVFEDTDSITIIQGDSAYLEGAWQTTAGIYYDTLIATNGCDSIVATTLTVVIGINEQLSIGNNQITIHPNPTEGKFRVESLEFGVETIEIYDLYGRLLLRSNKPEIDMSSYPAGLYIWSVGEARGKVVKE